MSRSATSPALAKSVRGFSLAAGFTSPEGLRVVCGGYERHPPGPEISYGGFPYYTLEFVPRGSGSLELADECHVLGPGVIFAHGPDQVCQLAADAPLDRYHVGFCGERARALLDEYGPAPGTVRVTAAPSAVLNLFDELLRTGSRTSPHAERIVTLMLEQLILVIADTASHGHTGGAAFVTYLRCRQHIEAHWSRISTLEQLAHECEVDPAYVCRLFRRFDCRTPYQYLVRQKVLRAADRLTEGGTNIKRVAEEFGFGDPFHFSRVFRKVMGVSPGRFARVQYPRRQAGQRPS